MYSLLIFPQASLRSQWCRETWDTSANGGAGISGVLCPLEGRAVKLALLGILRLPFVMFLDLVSYNLSNACVWRRASSPLKFS